MASRNLVEKVARELLTPERLPRLQKFIEQESIAAMEAKDLRGLRDLSLLAADVDRAAAGASAPAESSAKVTKEVPDKKPK